MGRGRRRGISLTKSLFVKLIKLPDAYSRRRQVPPYSWVANSWELPTRKNDEFLNLSVHTPGRFVADSLPSPWEFINLGIRGPFPGHVTWRHVTHGSVVWAAPFDAAARVTDTSSQGGVAIPDHNKIHIIGNPVCDGRDDLIVCILKLNNWGNFTILWSLQRRRVVFKFAFWEKAAECHLLGRCTLMRCQRNGK